MSTSPRSASSAGEPDAAVDAGRDVVGLLQQRREPLAAASASTSISGCAHVALAASTSGMPPRLHRRAGRRSCLVSRRDRGRVVRVRDRAVRIVEVGDRAGQQQPALVVALLGQPVEVDRLVGEDVRLVAEDVVEAPQLLVEEARRPGGREHEPRAAAPRCSAACGRTAARAWPARAPAWPARAARRPSGTRSRRRTAPGRRRPGPARVNTSRSDGRASFWLSTRCCAVVTPTATSRRSGRRSARSATGSSPAARRARSTSSDAGLTNVVNPTSRSASSQLGGRVVRQQHGRVLADVPAQVLGVEVVAVQVATRTGSRPARSRPSRARELSGNGNHEPK